MLATDKKFTLPTRALEAISKATQVPQSEVTRLYEHELAELSARARISGFLPIFAMRKVEETLNHRRAAALSV